MDFYGHIWALLCILMPTKAATTWSNTAGFALLIKWVNSKFYLLTTWHKGWFESVQLFLIPKGLIPFSPWGTLLFQARLIQTSFFKIWWVVIRSCKVRVCICRSCFLRNMPLDAFLSPSCPLFFVICSIYIKNSYTYDISVRSLSYCWIIIVIISCVYFPMRLAEAGSEEGMIDRGRTRGRKERRGHCGLECKLLCIQYGLWMPI